MTLGELANVGEFLSGIGVIITLIFVGVQLRQNTRAIQRSTAREAGNALVAAVTVTAESAELSDIIVRALESPESLTVVEKTRFDSWFYCWLHAHEQEHLVSRESVYLDELLAPKRRAIAGNLLTLGGAQWWQERRAWFTDHFQAVVDDIIANPPPGFEQSGHGPTPHESE